MTLRRRLSYDQVRRLLKAMPSSAVLMLHGGVGIGKTALIQEAAHEAGAELLVLRASELRPEELGGLPALSEAAGCTRFLPLEIFHVLTETKDDGRPVWLFLDELTAAQRDMQSALLYLLLERTIGLGGRRIRDDVRIVAAGNREQDNSYSIAFSAAMSTRMTHVELDPNPDEWRHWARINGVRPSIIAFIGQRERFFNVPADEGRDDYTHPTPRSWARLSELLHALEEAGEECLEIRGAAIEGTVGLEAGSDYITYERMVAQLVSVDEITTSPETARVHESPDRVVAVLENLFHAILRDPDRHLDPSLTYVARLPSEFQALQAHRLLNQRAGGVPPHVLRTVLASPKLGLLQGWVVRMANLPAIAA